MQKEAETEPRWYKTKGARSDDKIGPANLTKTSQTRSGHEQGLQPLPKGLSG